MRTIPLTQGFVTLVDDEDYDRALSAGKWYARRDWRTFYAVRDTSRKFGKQKIRLHAFLTGWPLVDHINGDGLDNRRSNLRPATTAENGQNRRMQRNNTSGFKGVSRRKGASRWQARIHIEGSSHHLGYYNTAREAALTYDEAARALHGAFAVLNFPKLGERGAA